MLSRWMYLYSDYIMITYKIIYVYVYTLLYIYQYSQYQYLNSEKVGNIWKVF